MLVCKNKDDKVYVNALPFTSINDACFNELFSNVIADVLNTKEIYNELNEIDFKMNDIDSLSLGDDIDPDLSYYSVLKNNKSLYYTEKELNKVVEVNDYNFNILHVNCRSIRKNFDGLIRMLKQIKMQFHCIVVTETWLNDNDNMEFYNIDGFKINFVHRTFGKGGGILIYINNEFSSLRIEHLCVSEEGYMESLALEVNYKNKKLFTIAGVYKPPQVNLQYFNSKFMDYLEDLGCHDSIYVCGDFNINLLNCDRNTEVKNFVDMMFSVGLHPLINKPTRINKMGASLIDNIWCNKLPNDENFLSGIIVDDISDHLPIFMYKTYLK